MMYRRMFRFLLAGALATVCAVGRAEVAGEGPREAQQRLADGLYARGLYDMALEEYEGLLRAHPRFDGRSVVLFRAAESARNLEQADVARRYYQQAAETGEGDAARRARLRLADLALRAGDFAAAAQEAEKLLALEPDASLTASALHTLGLARQRGRDLEGARAAYTRLVREHEGDVFAGYAALALASLEARDSPQRREWFERALRNPASRDLEVEALWGLAGMEMETGEIARAADLYKRLWTAHPDSARVRGGALHVAWALFQAGRYAEALEVARAVPAARKVNFLDTWLYLEGVSLRETGAHEGALAAFSRLIDEVPASRFRAQIALDLALIYAEQGEHEAVLGLRNDLMSLSERRVDAMWLLAESARLAGQREEALRMYQNLARIQDDPERAADARHRRAVMLSERDPEAGAEALREFASRVPEDPRSPVALRQAGVLLVEKGQLEQAAALWDQALRTYPDMADAAEMMYQTALLEMRAGKSEAAIRRLRAYRELDPKPDRLGESAFWLGMLLEQAEADGTELLLREAMNANTVSPARRDRARLRLGMLLQRQERPADAVEILLPLLGTEGSALIGDALLIWMLRGSRALGLDDELRAIADEMVQEARPASMQALGYFSLGSLAEGENAWEAAIEHWQRGLALNDTSVDALEARVALARGFLRLGRVDDADPQLEQAARMASEVDRPDLHGEALMGLGDVHAARGEWREAARLYMSMAVLYDDPARSPRALHAGAEALARSGQEGAASRARRELRQRYPEFDPIAHEQERAWLRHENPTP